MKLSNRIVVAVASIVLALGLCPAFALADDAAAQPEQPMVAQEGETYADGFYKLDLQAYKASDGTSVYAMFNLQKNFGKPTATVEDGVITVTIKNNVNSFDRLFLGTIEEANANTDESKVIVGEKADATVKGYAFTFQIDPSWLGTTKSIALLRGDATDPTTQWGPTTDGSPEQLQLSFPEKMDLVYTEELPDISTSFGMFNLVKPAILSVNGDDATITVTSHTYDSQGAPKYDAIYIGKRSELSGDAPTEEEAAKLIMGIPVYEGDDEKAKYDDGNGIVYEYKFEIPLTTAEAEAKLTDNKAEDIYFVARYSDHYVNASGSGDLAGKWSGSKDQYLTLEKVEKDDQTYDIAEGQIADIPDQQYTGKVIEPEPVVTIHGKTLVKGTDYEIAGYTNNINAGTAKVTITGKGIYYGSLSKEFKIVGGPETKDISKATVSEIDEQPYTGKAIEPTFTVKYEGTTLVAGTDYEVEYGNNVNVGTAGIIITGKGDYTGTLETTFDIVKTQAATIDRLAGDNAIKTMDKIVRAGNFAKGGTVILASVEGYWDALTAAGIAGLEDAPVIMTWGTALADEAAALLKELAPTKIIVCGGTGTVTNAVVEAAKAAAGSSPEVDRASGDNAQLTAIDAFEKGKKIGEGWSDKAVLATAGTFQDALAAAPLAFANRMPIFLAGFDFETEKGFIADATISAMKEGGIKTVYIAGGSFWIPDEVQKQLEEQGMTVVRLAGKTSVETSSAIANAAVEVFGMSVDGLGLANADEYYDALAGAAFCGKSNTVMLLANDGNRSSIETFVKAHAAEITKCNIFGGENSVSKETAKLLADVTK